MTRPGPRPLALVAIAFLAALAVATWSPTARPAAAHDQLMGSTPGADDEVGAAPAEVVLEFGGQPLTIGATVIVADGEGTDWAEGTPTVEGREVRAAVRAGMPDGYYQVRWRIVSGDGAVVSGSFDFGVGDLSGAERVALPASADAGQQTASGDYAGDFQDVGDDDASEATTASTSSDPPRVLVGLAGAAAALLLVAAYGLLARAATTSTTSTTPPEEP